MCDLLLQEASNNQCGKDASCKAIQGIGICTYDDVPSGASNRLVAETQVALPEPVETTLDLSAVNDGSHYEDPNTGHGCEPGEVSIRVAGLTGDMYVLLTTHSRALLVNSHIKRMGNVSWLRNRVVPGNAFRKRIDMWDRMPSL